MKSLFKGGWAQYFTYEVLKNIEKGGKGKGKKKGEK